MSEPLREQWLEAVVDAIETALAVPHSWGSYPASTVERRYKPLTTLGNRLRVLVLDGDGSQTPTPEDRDGAIDDRVAFDLLIQVRGDDVDPPSRWGNRALDTIKRTLRAAVLIGALGFYTKAPVEFDPEAVIFIPEDGRFAEFILPCTARLAENIGGEA